MLTERRASAPAARPVARVGGSIVEAELHDVAVLHDVVLAFEARLALRARLDYRAGRDEVVERDDLGLDEALLEVGVDHTGRLRGLPALADRPGASLLRTRRELGLEAEGVEADARELVETRLLLPCRGQQLRRVRGVEVDQLGLDLGVQENGVG